MFAEVDVNPPGPVHANVSGATPPVAFSVIAPVDAVHPASVTAGAIAIVLVACPTAISWSRVHPLTSVTVI
jgi:hypothetical protein